MRTVSDQPLANVTFLIGDKKVRTDDQGRFLLKGLEGGHEEAVVDGRSASKDGKSYGVFEIGVDVVQQATTKLPFTVWMPEIDTAHKVRIESPTKEDLILTTPKAPGLEVHIPKGTVVTDVDGKVVNELSLTPISSERPPFPLPPLVNTPIYFTIQPGGAYFSKPAQIFYPNSAKAPAGMKVEFWNYDPEDQLGWSVYGKGNVSKDAKQIVPDAGTQIYETTGAMVNAGLFPALIRRLLDTVVIQGGDPVDLGTGLFISEKTDLALPDVLPLSLTRTYRPADTQDRPFGIGSNHSYGIFLYSAQQYQEIDLVLPDSATVHYVRTSAGTGYADAAFEAQTTPGLYYRSKIAWRNDRGWDLTLKDGSVLVFGENAPLQAIRDRNGNQLTINRPSGPRGNITQIIAPHGRFVDLSYDTSNRVTQAKDNIGRTVAYEYDADGRLWKVTDAAGGVTEYGYDTSNRMTTIKDARAITFLTNQYDSSSRVTKQTQADGTTFQFAYSIDANGKVTQTQVTDPRGMIERVNFDSAGLATSQTVALGKPEEETTSFERFPTTNLLKAVVDPLSRRSEFTYDPMGNVLTTTNNAGTADAVTSTLTYEPTYNLIKTAKDPLNKTTTFDYFPNGNLKSVTDPLGHASSFEYDLEGLPLKSTDALNNDTLMAYDLGDPTSVTDPIGRKATSFLDSAGRLMSATGPDGGISRSVFDPLNNPTRATNSQGASTNFGYDPNGNLLSFKDAKNNETVYTVDNMDRVNPARILCSKSTPSSTSREAASRR